VSEEEILRELAGSLGVEAGYHDIWGHWHGLSPGTARAVLAALGLADTDIETLQRSGCRLAHADWQRLAPPVVVVRDGEPCCVDLTAAEAATHARLSWRLCREDGLVEHGEVALQDLEDLVTGSPLEPARTRRRLRLPDGLPLGYHTLALDLVDQTASVSVVRAPARCHDPGARRHWGVATQLYALRSSRNWGIGDFGDLRRVIGVFAPLGAAFIGINPLHDLYPHAPERASPYSPSSRVHVNPMYLDIESMADFRGCQAAREAVADDAFRSTLAALRESDLVDYVGVARSKSAVLEIVFQHFLDSHLGSGDDDDQAFAAFRDVGGRRLHDHALFQTLDEHFGAAGTTGWPQDYRDPGSAEVAAFARARADRLLYFQYLQWQCELQLAECDTQAREAGMAVGLYLDLAVGSDAAGSDVWSDPSAYARGVSLGAPPDDFAPQGQVWGLPPWRPQALRDAAYAPFIHCLRASMRHAGALRIDHVLGLLRLFWVPDGGQAADGAYVHYALHDLLAIAALESVREGCVVVGEDLGTVPDPLRAALAEFGVLSYRVFYFEKHWHGDHSFRAPADYPRDALTTLSTHDLPTLAGFWTGRDLALRHELSLFPGEGFEADQRATREHDRWRILEALEREGLRPAIDGAPGETPPPWSLVEAVHRFLARSRSALFSVQIEDMLGVTEQVNLPGTVGEQPNWRRKLPLSVEELAHHPQVLAAARAIDRERGAAG
jgi:(1->4)-alpha-D-glucan 1-alpha-D-glucosylmutase